MMGVRVSIVASADLSILQLKTQGRNVVPYIKIMTALMAEKTPQESPCPVSHIASQKNL